MLDLIKYIENTLYDQYNIDKVNQHCQTTSRHYIVIK